MFAYQLLPSSTTTQLEKEVGQINTVSDNARLDKVRNAVRKYYALGYDGNQLKVVWCLDHGKIIFNTPSAKDVAIRLGSIKFRLNAQFAQDEFGYAPPKRGKGPVAKSYEVDLYRWCFELNFWSHFWQVVYSEIQYIPGSVSRELPSHVLSTWRPSPYFFPLPGKNTSHSPIFHPYLRFYQQYFAVIDSVASNTLGDYHEYYPETLAIYYFFLMVFHICEANELVFRYVLKWVAYVMYSGDKAQTALVFFSKDKGLGKSLFVKILAILTGNLHNVTASHLLKGNFLGDIFDVQLLAVEEFSAKKGGRKNDSKASDFFQMWKNLVTNDLMVTEKKYQKAVQNTNFISYIATLNHPPSTLTELGCRRNIICKSSNGFKELNTSIKEYEKKPFTVIVQDILESKNNNKFLFPKDGFSKLEYEECECNTTQTADHCAMAFLALVFLKIYEDHPTFVPFDRPPLTRLHITLQLDLEVEVKMLWEFYCRKSNSFFNKGGPCLVAGCTLTAGEHFDSTNPGWQLEHLNLSSYVMQKNIKLDDVKLEQFGIQISHMGSTLFPVYQFPTLKIIEQQLIALLNISNRTLAFDMKSLF